ncbi:MAG: DUF58 domain-containing protein [Gemmataceae bacterium]|nr:DUF58 domain-containing protein [Gemmataceae bacterium]
MNLPLDPTTLASYGRLAFAAREVVEGLLSGMHKSPYKGYSVEFAEHRQYVPGDEIRHIDWRVLGKTDRYFIKEYEEETNLQAHLLVDASGSMGFGKPSKYSYACHAAAALSYLMLRQLDQVGLIVHDHAIRTMLPLSTASKHWLRIVQTLESAKPGGETALSPLWHRLCRQLCRRGLIVVLSDGFDRIDDLILALRDFRHAGHEVIFFHVLAPEEIDFPFQRMTQFRSLEQGNQKLVDPRQLRADYLRNFQSFCERLQSECGKMRIDFHRLRTDQPIAEALGHYLAARRK